VLTGSSPYMESRHPRHGPSAAEWESVKNVIRQLYVYEHLPLKEVREHLEANYNFSATYDSPKSPYLAPSSP
jgi:hypothetical protein